MAIELEMINSKFSQSGDYMSLPSTGFSLNWGGKLFCVTLNKKRFSLGFEEAPPSKLNQIKSLPRMSGEFDYAGKRFTFKSASILEAIKNVKDKKVKSFSEAFSQQIDEILLPQSQIGEFEKIKALKNESSNSLLK